MKLTYLFLLALLPSLASCGSNSSGGDDPNEGLRKELNYTGDFTDFGNLVAEKATLECDEDSCPESVVSIYTEAGKTATYGGYEYSMQLCSGTLIAPNLILTNFHCIEKDFGQAIPDCKGKVYVRTQDGQTVGCQEITYDSTISFLSEDDGIVRRDVALIKLDRDVTMSSPDAILKVVPTALSEKETYSSYVVNFGSSLSEPAKIDKKTCKVMEDNSIFPLGGVDRKSFEFLGDCDVIQGNSGSALLSDKNEIVGLIFARIQFDKIQEAWSGILDKMNHYWKYDSFTNLHAGLAVSFACLESPAVENFAWSFNSDSCPDSLDKEDQTSYFKDTILSLDDLIIQFANKDQDSELEKYFQYKVERDDYSVYTVPKCFEAKIFKKDFPDATDMAQLKDLELKRRVTASFEVDAATYSFKIDPENSYTSTKTYEYFVKSSELGLDTDNYSSSTDIISDCSE